MSDNIIRESDEIMAEINAGRLIGAIKKYREATRASLKAAKDAIEVVYSEVHPYHLLGDTAEDDPTKPGRALVASADAPAIDPDEPLKPYRPRSSADDPEQWYTEKEIIASLQARAEKAEAAYHASEQQFVALAQVLGVPYELNTQQDLVAMVKARLQAADEVAKVVQTMLDLIESWTYTDSDDYPRISDDLGQVLDACIPLRVALTFYRKNQS